MAPAYIAFLIALAASVRDDSNIGKWTASAWSRCSSPCGPGTAYRHVECRSQITNQILPHEGCSAPKPPTKKFCSSLECQWGCTLKSVKPVCLAASLKQVPDDFCNMQKHPGNFTDDFICPYGHVELWQPLDLRSSHDGQSESSSFSWMILSPWSSCSPHCGSNRFSWRHVACVDSTGGIVDDTFCSGSAPSDRRSCPGTIECSVQHGRCRPNDGNDVADYWCFNKTGLNSWRIESDWSPCSIPTWLMTTRRVYCRDPPCEPSDRPSNIQSCALLPPLTYQLVSSDEAPLCTNACGPGVISNPYQCRFQNFDLDDEYCQAAGVPDPVPIPCKTQTCMSSKPCDLHARLNISIPPGAFANDDQIRLQLELDLKAALPNATSVLVSVIRPIAADDVEAEFSVSCMDGSVSAADSIEMQMSDPGSAFRRGVVTRGSNQHLEIFAFQQPAPVSSQDAMQKVSSDDPIYTFKMATLYIALAVFVAVFVVIRYGVRRAAAKAKIQPPINTMFSVNELDPYTAQATANLKSQSQTVVPGTRRNSITVPGPSGS